MKRCILLITLMVAMTHSAEPGSFSGGERMSNARDERDSELSPGPSPPSPTSKCKTDKKVSIKGFDVEAVIGRSKLVTLLCEVKDVPTDIAPLMVWYAPGGSLLSFQQKITLPSYQNDRVIANDSSTGMSLTFKHFRLSDAGNYTCELTNIKDSPKSYVFLTVNQLANITIDQNSSPIFKDTEATLATCHALNAKPKPNIWFEDSTGAKVNTFSNLEETSSNGLYNVSLKLTKVFTQKDNGESYFCVMEQKEINALKFEPLKPVNVYYSPTAEFSDPTLSSSVQLIMEGENFEARCTAEGNPPPQFTWFYEPQATGTDSDSPTVEFAAGQLPPSFGYFMDGKGIISNSVQTGNNNGTFTCTADNGVGQNSSVSFKLEVYDKPTTPPPPTTTAKDPGSDAGGFAAPTTTLAPTVDAAVIGGVVAVAVFVLIVTIIILLRYFMAHKGEYYTNELKASHDVEEMSVESEDDDLPTTEAELLGEKKRTEHFL